MMMRMRTFFRRRWPFLLLILLGILSAVGFYIWRAVTPRTPSAFYNPPIPLPAELAAIPGSIIRSEPITEALPEGAVGWRVLYTSVGVDGQPIAVSGVIAAPAGPAASSRPILAFAQGTIGILPACGIGHTPTPFVGIPAIETMIAEGYVVAVTDYPGRATPGVHPYLVGEVAAAAVLDSARAARALGTGAGDQVVVWGRSQGGHSALWTAIRAADYAPELTLVAAAASAPAVDLAGILRYGFDKVRGTVVLSYALTAWAHYYPDVDLNLLIQRDQRARFDRIARTCLTTPAAFLLLGDLPTPNDFLAVDVLADPAIQRLIAQHSPTGPIPVPLLIAHGVDDELIPFAGSEAEVARRCDLGEDVRLVRYPGVGHDAAEQSALMILGWFDDRLAGRPTGSACAGS